MSKAGTKKGSKKIAQDEDQLRAEVEDEVPQTPPRRSSRKSQDEMLSDKDETPQTPSKRPSRKKKNDTSSDGIEERDKTSDYKDETESSTLRSTQRKRRDDLSEETKQTVESSGRKKKRHPVVPENKDDDFDYVARELLMQEDVSYAQGEPTSVLNDDVTADEIFRQYCSNMELIEKNRTVISFSNLELIDLLESSNPNYRWIFDSLVAKMNDIYKEYSGTTTDRFSLGLLRTVREEDNKNQTSTIYYLLLEDRADYGDDDVEDEKVKLESRVFCRDAWNVSDADLRLLHGVSFLETTGSISFEGNVQRVNNFAFNKKYKASISDVLPLVRTMMIEYANEADTSYRYKFEIKLPKEYFLNESFVKELIAYHFFVDNVITNVDDRSREIESTDFILTRNVMVRDMETLMQSEILLKEYSEVYFNQYKWFIDLYYLSIPERSEIKYAQLSTIGVGLSYEFCKNVFERWMAVIKDRSVDDSFIDKLITNSWFPRKEGSTSTLYLGFKVKILEAEHLYDYIGVFLTGREPISHVVFRKNEDNTIDWIIIQSKFRDDRPDEAFIRSLYGNLKVYKPVIILPFPNAIERHDHSSYIRLLDNSRYFTSICVGGRDNSLASRVDITLLYYYRDVSADNTYSRLPTDPTEVCKNITNLDDTGDLVNLVLSEYNRLHNQCWVKFSIKYRVVQKLRELLTEKHETGGKFAIIEQHFGKQHTYTAALEDISQFDIGNSDSVSVKNGKVRFHTHPYHCYSANETYMGTPSGQDIMEVFSYMFDRGYAVNVVISREGVYTTDINHEVINFFRDLRDGTSVFYPIKEKDSKSVKILIVMLGYIFSGRDGARSMADLQTMPILVSNPQLLTDFNRYIRRFSERSQLCMVVPLQIITKIAETWVKFSNEVTLQSSLEIFKESYARGLFHELNQADYETVVRCIDRCIQRYPYVANFRLMETTFTQWKTIEENPTGEFKFEMKYENRKHDKTCPSPADFSV